MVGTRTVGANRMESQNRKINAINGRKENSTGSFYLQLIENFLIILF